MKSLTENNWSGWNPSASDKGDPSGQGPLQLLRMDNLTQDEQGILRLAKTPKLEGTNQFSQSDILAIFSTTLNGIKTRFVYAPQGTTNKAILCTTNDPRNFSTTLVTQAEPSQRCAFINTLGQVIMCAGGIQRKFDGTNNFTLGIPAPSPPTISIISTNTVDLSNLDGGGNYTNWTSITSATFNNAGANVHGTGLATASNIANVFSFKTTYGAPVDTTNLGGTGKDTPDDDFIYFFEVDDQTQLAWVHIELHTDANNYFYFEWDFPGNPSFPDFNIVSGVTTPVQMLRSAFNTVGGPAWNNINSATIQVGISGSSNVTWSGYFVSGGSASIQTGNFNYVAVQVNNTGGFLEFSPASTIVLAIAPLKNTIKITPAGAVDAQANQYWLFRQDLNGGNYYLVNIQTGAYGFSPVAFTDFKNLDDLITAANINPLNVLQFYRQPLPTNIIDMIWFRDRVIYLTTNGFIPSFKLDPGSYDSRFVYQLIGSTSEACLFIAKLDVGTFVVATTRDFYRVTGTFSIQIDPNDPTGQVQFQDVTITPLGIADPAISRAFTEYQGTIIYASATGIRVLSNATSTLINDNLDLLFRKEPRYDLPAIQLLPFDQSIISVVSQGSRIYFSLPHADGINRVYVLNIANQTNAMYLNTRSWRLLTQGDVALNPRSMCMEEDGTILYGGFADPKNYIYSLENDNTGMLPVKFRTQFNYGGNPMIRKDALGFKCKIDTGNFIANLVIRGLQYDGSFKQTTVQFSTTGNTIISLDIKEQQLTSFNQVTGVVTVLNTTVGLPPSIAYSVEIACLTSYFRLEWFTLTYEERPAGVRRVIIYSSPLDKAGRKRIGTWPFVADPMGLLSNNPTNITALMTIDRVVQPAQKFTNASAGPQTFFWDCDPTKDILGYDWALELIGDEEFEFYKFLPPDITQETPALSNQVISPASNFDIPGRKRVGVWPFRANLRGSTISILVTVDGVALPLQFFSNNEGDRPETYGFIPPDDILGVDWEMEIVVTNGIGIEFYEFLKPMITQQRPEQTNEAILPVTNFDSAGRKRLSNLPFVADLLGHTATIKCRADGIEQTPITVTPLNPDEIQTFDYFPPASLLAVDWQIRVVCDKGMEFDKFLAPVVSQPFPPKTNYAIQPSTNFGKPNLKKVSVWPFIANALGHSLIVLVTIDGVAQPVQSVTNNIIGTLYWRNNIDISGIDWQIEVYTRTSQDAETGLSVSPEFEFYKFLAPEMLQIFPVAKLIDQIGPLDFNKQGLTFGARFRVMGSLNNQVLTYIVYAGDVPVETETISLSTKDDTYVVKWNKGIVPAICRLVLSSPQVFYRFSVELKVRITGNETEEKYIMVPDVNAK